MKELKYIPIYKGRYNTKPEEYQEEYLEYEEEEGELNIVIEYSPWEEWAIVALCIGYIILAVIR